MGRVVNGTLRNVPLGCELSGVVEGVVVVLPPVVLEPLPKIVLNTVDTILLIVVLVVGAGAVSRLPGVP